MTKSKCVKCLLITEHYNYIKNTGVLCIKCNPQKQISGNDLYFRSLVAQMNKKVLDLIYSGQMTKEKVSLCQQLEKKLQNTMFVLNHKKTTNVKLSNEELLILNNLGLI